MKKKNFLFNVVIFFAIIFSLEIIARAFHLADLTGISKNLLIFEKNIHTNSPNAEAIVFSKKTFIDEFGFRVPKKDFNYNERKSSILIIGDSVSFGVGVEEENSFIGKLRNEFRNLNFLNSSVSGYHLKHYPEIIKRNKNIDSIKEVIFFYTLNDISFQQSVVNWEKQIEENENVENTDFFNKLKKNRYFAKINSFLRSKSVFYMWFKGIVSKPSERYFYYIYSIYQNNSAIKELNEEFIKLRKIVNEKNFKLTIIILPYEYQTRKKNCSNGLLLPQNIVKDILINLKIKFKDYTKIFCDYERPNFLFLKFDPVHLSYAGHKLVFDLLKKDLNYLENQ